MSKAKRFGVMLDMSRNAVMKPAEVKNFARILKNFGYNMIQLYTEDTFEVEGEPYFGYMRGRYTADELRDIFDYCDGLGIEVIPCVQEIRLGALMLRMRSAKARVEDYLAGNIDKIEELEAQLLDIHGGGTELSQKLPVINSWQRRASVNVMSW